ncbi:retrovirus-related pol polyprotein from transposon TNT 1-94 [Tanacetum coccineum]
MHLQEIANQLPDAFTDTKRVTKSHIPAANAPASVEIPNHQAGDNIAKESQKRLKRGRPIGSKDKNPRKRKETEKNSDHDENVLDETQDIRTSPEEEMNDTNKEMSINYSQTNILWDRNEIGDIDEIFSYFVASDIMSGDDDPEPKSVFGPIVTTPRDVKPVGCRWIFVQKRNEKNEVTRYLISLAVSRNLEMRLMDVVTAYLYGSIDNDIYMKIPEGFKIPESLSSKPKRIQMDPNNDMPDFYEYYSKLDMDQYTQYCGYLEQLEDLEEDEAESSEKVSRRYIARERELAEEKLRRDYFGDENTPPIYPEEYFR